MDVTRISWFFHTVCLLVLLLSPTAMQGHEAKDFDDSILYKIDFEMPDFDKNPELREHLRTMYTHEKEKYDCVIPKVEDTAEERKLHEPELSPMTLLQPLFTAPSCSYRIEAYWSYEICHGVHVRQYHDEREGKGMKSQEYYLGKWSAEKTEQLTKDWEEHRKSGAKYRSTKIDNTKYPYFEMAMTDGTLCDIINAPRKTIIRYVCYPHGKNEIYSFKETSSCNYEAIILTSVLCMIPAFHPEESKEVSIKCFNSPTEPHKPLSMLRQELRDMQMSDDDVPVPKPDKNAADDTDSVRVRNTPIDRFLFLERVGKDVDKLVLELMAGAGVEVEASTMASQESTVVHVEKAAEQPAPIAPLTDLSPIKEFISGKNCLTGGTGWWKYEFCYGRHVRQFHKDRRSETELYLGYFSENAHRQWVRTNPEKGAKRLGYTSSLWHHYEQGTHCDRTGMQREVDVKLTCTAVTSAGSPATVSMYLLEPKTCQYILVVESPIICELLEIADENGLVNEANLQQLLERESLLTDQGTPVSRPDEPKRAQRTLNRVTASLSEGLLPGNIRA